MVWSILNKNGLTEKRAFFILAAVTLAVYAISIANGFVIDDEVIIVKNPGTFSLASIPDLIFSPDVIKPYYRPLNRISYLLDFQLAGLNPAWYHAVNILTHLGCVLLLFLICKRLVSDSHAALFTALLFAVHPANTEAVNFISARNTLLAAFFSLASFLAFVRSMDRGARFPLLSAGLFFCGLLSKETGLMVIGVIGYCLLFPLPSFSEKNYRERIYAFVPYFLALVLYFLMRARALNGMVGVGIPSNGLFDRLAMNFGIVPTYLKLLLYPVDLTIFHIVPTGPISTHPWFFVAWVAMLAAVLLILRSRSYAALLGLFWCAINYVPISNIVPIPSDPITERFLYLPAIGAFVVLGALFAWVRTLESRQRGLAGAIALIVMVCGVISVQRTSEWKNEYSLYRSAVATDPSSVYAHYNLGTSLRERGNLVGARKEWERALEIDPTHSDSLTQLGTTAAVSGDMQSAIAFYSAALKAPPGKVDPTKAMIHYNLGKIYERLEKPLLALAEYEKCIQTVQLNYPEYARDVEQRIVRLRSSQPSVGGKLFP